MNEWAYDTHVPSMPILLPTFPLNKEEFTNDTIMSNIRPQIYFDKASSWSYVRRMKRFNNLWLIIALLSYQLQGLSSSVHGVTLAFNGFNGIVKTSLLTILSLQHRAFSRDEGSENTRNLEMYLQSLEELMMDPSSGRGANWRLPDINQTLMASALMPRGFHNNIKGPQ